MAISLRLPPFDFIIAYWLRTRLRIVQQSDLRGSLRVACPCNLAVPSFDFMGFPRGDRPSRVLGSARRLGKQRTYRQTGRCCRPEDGSPERLTLYFPRSPLQTSSFLFISCQKSSDSPCKFMHLVCHLALSAVLIAIFPLLELFKTCLLLDSHAHLASKAPSATTTACITPAILCILYAI